MSSDETTWWNETEFEIQNQSERVNPETIKRNCSGVRKYRFYKSLGSTDVSKDCRASPSALHTIPLIPDESEMNNRKFLTEENELYFSFKGKCFSSLSPSQIFPAHQHHSIMLGSMAPSYHQKALSDAILRIKNILKVRIIDIEYHSNIECFLIYFKLNCLLITFGSLFIFIFISQLTRICSKSADFSWETHSLKNLGTFLNATF